ncbi:hypothetical protein NDU88_004896 [Pleurodeles waltl]|uniref:Uncharacterized protein n=1 Tax=Pleurodeles waltl TaxID=8319 RepID=A0AAV7M7N1_PLEWA|nr:hypothetical protein NDU88_004896 [Pleurodeles waltl]
MMCYLEQVGRGNAASRTLGEASLSALAVRRPEPPPPAQAASGPLGGAARRGHVHLARRQQQALPAAGTERLEKAASLPQPEPPRTAEGARRRLERQQSRARRRSGPGGRAAMAWLE